MGEWVGADGLVCSNAFSFCVACGFRNILYLASEQKNFDNIS